MCKNCKIFFDHTSNRIIGCRHAHADLVLAWLQRELHANAGQRDTSSRPPWSICVACQNCKSLCGKTRNTNIGCRHAHADLVLAWLQRELHANAEQRADIKLARQEFLAQLTRNNSERQELLQILQASQPTGTDYPMTVTRCAALSTPSSAAASHSHKWHRPLMTSPG